VLTAAPYLQFVLHVLLLRTLNTFSAFNLSLSEVFVQCLIMIVIIIMHLCGVFTIMYLIKSVCRV
jgi:hypothetical protein